MAEMQHISKDGRIKITEEVRVIDEVDICVLGGSCTGVFAAVRAARLGARVAIVERQNCFGGMATAGLVNIWHSILDETQEKQIIAGMTTEVLERLKKRDALGYIGKNDSCFRFNSEELKVELDEIIRDHKITPYLHTQFVSSHVENDELKAVIIENKDGRQAIAAKVFIDATGDGDVARRLGCESYVDGTLQPPTMCCKMYGMESLKDWNWEQAVDDHGAEFGLEDDWGWRCQIPGLPGLAMHADTHVFDVNASNAADLTFAEMEGRRKIRAIMDVIRKYGPEGQQIGLAGLAASIGIRETDRIKAQYQVTGDDVLHGRVFEDAIGYGSYSVDIHHSDGPGITFRFLDGRERVIPRRGQAGKLGRWREETENNPTYYQIPYRSLVQNKVSNLLLAGRMLDADKVAYSAIRVMVNTNQTGEAAGVAAWLALDSGLSVKDVEPAKLRATMKDGGSIIFN
jgi:hypothetical protein